MPGPFSPDDQANPDIAEILKQASSLKAKLERTRAVLEAKRHQGVVEPRPLGNLSRADGLWPFLLIRSFPGDIGARPAQAPDMDHSPDIIMIWPDPAYEPTVVTRDGMAELVRRKSFAVFPGSRRDVWVHVWNLGRAPAHGVRVRAWVIDPAGGREFIGGRQLDLGDRTSSDSHLAVRIGSCTARPVGVSRRREIVATVECISDVATGATQDRHTGRYVFGLQGPVY